MDKKKIKKRKKTKGQKRININIKVSKEVSKWMKEKKYSPTGIFNEALKDLKCPHIK